MTKLVYSIPKEFQEWYNKSKFLKIQGFSFHDVFRDSSERVSFQSTSQPANMDDYIFGSFLSCFNDTVVRKSLRLMVTANGRVRMIPEKARKGDLVVVLLGCNVPVLLRRSSTAEENTYTLVGERFLDEAKRTLL
ncbi:hypothetical protein COCSADRAFT_162756 [Bipolaris sorokiniana ND90Pr]|uniref:Uncharacterized protein n=1 Tax=Cochliobolus sativus (strain ND90Pr / ATCC 201652) TaxID=665912 RepID=M2R200_COCSN|nr:uncharacterized protein COCSADRAFT_162756 [Bipolaris sorokiniana ND90Pr]EMD61279.1 hypothetical protein COCSADRAFT_162756 [Bipolaris sorokiniana ND90Pr]